MKNKNKNCFEPVVEQGYKKAYLMRRIEEAEAEEEMKEGWDDVVNEGSGYADQTESLKKPL